MSWTCKLHAERPTNPQPGDMWFAPWLLGSNQETWLSPNYQRDWAGKRPPLVVQMPDGSEFCLDGPFLSKGNPYGDGWKVTGDAPKITMSPSINLFGTYHGWLRDGVISDDCEGRKF